MIDLGFSRGHVPTIFQTVKHLFPDEHAFIPPDAIEERETVSDALMPGLRFNSLLGLRQASKGNDVPFRKAFNLDAQLPSSKEQRFRERLSMALHALGVTKREARFEADLIACWASMCNIKYNYLKEDSFAVGLQKVLKAMRNDLGLTVYNFLVNTHGGSAEVDLSFMEYATAHKQSGGGYFHGLPIFTGWSSTATHLPNAISQPLELATLKGSGVNLRRLPHSLIKDTIKLTDIQRAKSAIDSTSFVPVSGFYFRSLTAEHFKDILQHTTKEAEHKILVIADIRVEPRPGRSTLDLSAWAICPIDIELSRCFVARESLNGTLVLAMPNEEWFHVVAYLTTTEGQSGTHLLKVDEHGNINTPFPATTMAFSPKYGSADCWQVKMEEDTITAM
jgi:hypothetical protein